VNLHWRQAESSDLHRINEIADQIHTDLPERPEVFAEKLSLFPSGCMVMHSADAPTLVGYGISHPWNLHAIPPLDTFLEKLPVRAECIYVHDVAVLPSCRGGRSAGAYIELLALRAASLRIRFMALVSVYNTDPLWTQFGFRVLQVSPEMKKKLSSYGETAKYMVRDLGSTPPTR
jgi:hypothetical protein